MSKTIQLTQGRVAIVNDADCEWLSQWKWSTVKGRFTYYARRSIWKNGKRTYVRMHRVILNTPPGKQTDHINGDGLDNRRGNLRVCTNSQNQMNSRKRLNCSSIYKGVYWDSCTRRWRALIRHNKRLKSLGRYDTQREAAMAYDEAAQRLFEGFALPNFGKEAADGS